MLSSTNVPLASIKMTSIESSTIESSSNELIINDIVLNSNGILIISWDYMLSQLPKYYHIQIYDKNNHRRIYERLIDGRLRSIEIDITGYIQTFPTTLTACINIEYKRYCRNIFLQSTANLIKSASFAVSTNKYDHEQQYIYLLGGILLGAILVCSVLIIICCCRLRYYSKANLSQTSSINSDEKSLKTFCYHPLNIISYPPQASSNTSECSLHSSVDVSHSTNDPYHLYHQIPSVYNCQLYPKTTHIVI